MRRSIIKKLFLTNLLYVNPLQTTKYRKKYKGQDIRTKVFKNLLLLTLLNILIVTVFFGNPFTSSLYSGNMYLRAVAFISVLSLLSIATTFLNMFYESADTLALLTLPISDKELFLSKFFVLLFQLTGLIIPFTVINFAVGLTADFSILKFLFVLVYTLATLTILVGTIVIVTSFITYVPNFQKNKSKINGILSTLGIIGILAFIPFSKISQDEASNKTNYSGDILLNTLQKPMSETFFTLTIFVIIALIVANLVYKLIAKNYFNTIYRISGINIKHKQKKKDRKTKEKNTSLNTKLIKRNIKLFSNGTLITNVFSNVLLGVIVLIGGAIQVRSNGALQVGLEFYPAAIAFGLAMSYLMLSNPISFPGVAISLEKQDYYHLRSLPIDFKKYLKIKLATAVVLQLVLALILFLGILIFSKLSPMLILISSISFSISSIAISIHSFIKDYKKLYLNWNNIVELSTRGASQIIFALIMILIIFGLTAITMITAFIITIYPKLTHIFGISYTAIILIFFAINVLRLNRQVLNKIK